MDIECITEVDKFQSLKDEWNRLLFSSDINCIFLTHEWFSSWWKSFSEDSALEILLFRDDARHLCGIAPLMRKEKNLFFISSQEVTDYCDFISLKECREEFYKNLLEYIGSDLAGKSIIELINIKSTSPSLHYLPRLSPKFNLSCSCEETEVTPFIVLPLTYESYISNLERKNRHELRRKLRRIQTEEGVQIKKISDPEELSSAIQIFIELHRSSHSSKERFWENRGMITFFKEIVFQFSLNGWLEANFLYFKDEIIASLINFTYSDEVSFYNVAYDSKYAWYSPGIFLFNQSIKQAIEDKRKRVDFLRGEEKYKYYFGAKACKIYGLKLTSGDNEG